MKAIRWLAAAALVAAPLVFETASAEAATANQYRAQGRGAYLTSKGNPNGWHRYGWRGRPYGWHRHWGPGYGWHRHHRWYRGY